MNSHNNRFSAIEKAIITDVNLAINDISGAKPILIVPFDGLQFYGNQLYNDAAMYDYNDINQEYDHTGTFIASASSNNADAYKAFNYSTSGWKSGSGGGQVPSQIYDVTTGPNGQPFNYLSAYGNVHFGPSFYNRNISTQVTAPSVKKADGTISTYNKTNVYGEWLQIKLPSETPVFLYRYSIKVPPPININSPKDQTAINNYVNNSDGRDPYYLAKANNVLQTPPVRLTSNFPKIFAVVGSLDGKNWYYIDQQAFIDPPDLPSNTSNLNVSGQGFEVDSSNNTVYFEVNSINHYTYFRLIITELFPGNSQSQIVQFSLFAFIDNVTPNKESLLKMSYGLPNLESFVTKNMQSSIATPYYAPYQDNLRKMDPFIMKQENSPQYVTGMDSTAFTWDYFGRSDDPRLVDEYNKQKSMISQAKTIPNLLSSLESYTIENFDSNGFSQGVSSDPNFVNNNQLLPMVSIYNDYLSKQQQVNQNYYDMSQNIHDFKHQYAKLMNDPNDKYDFKASSFNKAPTQLDGLINDNREIIMQQNSMYILSTITVTTLVLALILVYK
jgi:hypothetical protein